MSDELWKNTENEEPTDTEATVGTEETSQPEESSEPEETAALFVSAHKQKVAEEEARRIAEEEQAKKDAAAVEVIRMEKEVAAKKKAAVTAIKRKIIAIVVGILVFLIVAFILLLSGEYVEIHYDNLAFNGEYKIQQSGYNVTVKYPDSIYNNIQEEPFEYEGKKGVKLTMTSNNTHAPVITAAYFKETFNIYAFMNNFADNENGMNTIRSLYDLKATDFKVSGFDGDDEEKVIKAGGNYSADNVRRSVLGWYEKDSSKNVYLAGYCFETDEKHEKNTTAMCDSFEKNNSSVFLGRPGSNPPISKEVNGYIDYAPLNLRVPVADGRYFLISSEFLEESHEDKHIYIDENGAYLCFYSFPNAPLDHSYTEEEVNKLFENLSIIAKDGNNMFLNTQDRQLYLDTSANNVYVVEFNEKINGVSYKEIQDWTIIQGQDFWYILCTSIFVPSENEDVYRDMLKEGLSNWKIIQKL